MKVIWSIVIAVVSLFAQVDLTPNEKLFIKNHLFHCVVTPNWAPFNMLKDDKIEGIAIDYWKLIKHKLNLKSNCKILPSWTLVLEDIKNKNSDIVPATAKTPQKQNFALFTKPYATYPIVIATRNNIGFINSMAQLENKKIVVGKNYSAAEILKKHFPNLNIIEVKDIKTALDYVSRGKAFAAIDNLPVIAYNINKYQFANLKISGKTPFDFKVRFMVRNDYPLLVSAINKAIDSITPEEKERIFKKWVYVVYQTGIDTKKLLTIAFIAIGLILILIALVIYQFFEIKKRRKFETQLIKTATIDSLTGIFNRKHIDYMLQKEVEEAKRYANPLSIIFCDIDHFKDINDKFGHKVGDIVLEELARIMKQNIRKSDIIGRWGGEEFLIILPHTPLNEALRVAEKLQSAIRNYEFPKIGKITCSFGVTEFKSEDSIYRLMIRVDQALYEAKNTGRDKIVVKKD
ncbi:diguanylate cyclase [Caminibacter pacificus]|uniref:diguanylate cyclase n=2 Tax=Caminibacter pacificus TaxID=1424653 RepID=A0AAJ4UYT3_9BACT|nr:diguanylate cyclase [Caminibacter pacificus]QCI28165.1 diguanylate cyclase [Caminibacter pacificus]ROR41123.1 diguanylate cyclase (GGDEF)-like protein [Caminibacter pacificus]